MPDIDIRQLAGTLMPQVNPKQTQFITQYLDKSFLKKRDELAAQVNRACETLLLKLGETRGIVDQLAVAGRTKEDFDTVTSLRSRTGDVLSGLAHEPGKTKKALEKLMVAGTTLGAIANDARAYVSKLGTGGRDLGRESQIENERIKTRQRYLELDSAFGVSMQSAANRLREVAPQEPFAPAAVTEFKDAFRTYSSEINAVRSNDPSLTFEQAQTTFAGITRRMQETATTKTRELNALAGSPAFTNFLADMKIKAQVLGKLAETDEWLVTLDRWETAAREPIRDEVTRIRGEIDKTFVDREKIDPSAIGRLVETQKELLAAATNIAKRAGLVAQGESELFAQEQRALVERLNALDQRMKTAKKNLSSDQVEPALSVLASARLAVTGLNGCNLDALKTASGLLDAAGTVVTNAENARTINSQIETKISQAEKDAKAGSKESDPLHASYATLLEEITKFKDAWKSKSIADAQKEANALEARVTKLKTDSTAITNERNAINTLFQATTTELGKLNTAFKRLATGSAAAGLEYSGALKQELDMLRSWNATKTDIAFYTTIRAKLTALNTKIATTLSNITEISKLSDSEVMLQGLEADRVYQAKLKTLTDQSEDGVPDPAEVAKALKERDDKLDFLNTKLDLLAEANKSVADDRKDKADKESFLTLSKQFETEVLKEQKAAAKKDPLNAYEDEVKRHLDRLKTTRGLIRDNEGGVTGASALSELKFIQQAVQMIRNRGEKTSKSKLGEIRDQWEKEVDKFAKSAVVLMKAIEDFEVQQSVVTKASPEIQKVLTTVIGQMNAHRFAEPAMVLGAEDSDDAARRSAREKALDEVRRLRKVIFDDPVIQKCVLNPFGIGGLGTTAQYRLEEIELNVLRGV